MLKEIYVKKELPRIQKILNKEIDTAIMQGLCYSFEVITNVYPCTIKVHCVNIKTLSSKDYKLICI